MAIYYLNVQIIGRSAGRSATAAAAYRAGERIVDERTGRIYDYTRRQGEIETQIHAPDGAPDWVQDRSRLWNEVERVERRADAQVCREMVVAFPKELSPDQQRELIRSYVQEQFASKGMVADVAIHRNDGNPHAHIMLTMRKIGPEGFATTKSREWNRPEVLEQWRTEWAAESNRALERAGREERIDHRRLADQSLERLPQVHLGPHSAALERQGITTEKGDHNRAVSEHNAVVIDLEKAREEKRQLLAEKSVTDRYYARLDDGWSPNYAKALGQLEYDRGGSELTQAEVSSIASSHRKEITSLQARIEEIHKETRRLEWAEELLSDRGRAVSEVDRLKAPLATVKRWFNEGARKEFSRAQDRVSDLDDRLGRIGTTSGEQLKEQRCSWERENAKVPAMQTRITELSPVMNMAFTALDGFIQEAVRRQRERERDRERGRDWER